MTLTDGLDTSGVEIAEARRATARAALAAATPLFFVVGHNRAIAPAFFRLREFNVPAQTEPHSIIKLEAIFESYQTAASTVSVTLTVTGNPRPPTSLRVEAGRHLETWAAEGPADSPGLITFELHAGPELARAEVRVTAPPANRILYDEGALDWGYRFLADILKRNEAFSLTPVFDFPNPGIALPPGAIARMPSPQGLSAYSIIVLANAVANQIPPAEQEALTQWVNDGGILLFLTPDDDSTQAFAGSELEKMLPVVFRAPGTDLAPAASNSAPARLPKLIPFAWESTPRVREIFAQTPEGGLAEETPRFSTYAHVERAKPGAEVLARHPSEKGPDGEGAILLAVQRYGHGKSVVFATDALWRWRLSQSSGGRGTELFWENFFAWLGRDRDTGFYFDHPPIRSPLGQDVTLHLVGAGTKALHVEASLEARRIELTELPGDDTSRVFHWRPPASGLWQVEAKDATGDTTHTWLSVDRPGAKAGELPAAAPDEELLRSLAAQTSGSVLETVVPTSWRPPAVPPGQLLNERRQPLWHHSWVLAVLLGVYGLELLLRRRWKLL